MKTQKFYFSAALAVFALLVGVLLSTPSTQAQSAFGSIVGTVTDTSGAAVPGVNVSLTNIGTNDKKSMQTDATGNYRFVNLPPTQYKVEFEKANYKRSVHTPITVLVDSTGRLDVTLEVGAVSETVEVTTQAPLLQTESGTLGSQVEGKTVTEMPLNGRNVTNLIALVPGVVPQGASMGNTTMNQGTHTNNAGWGNFQIGGAISGTGSFFLDGAPLSTAFGHDVAFIPTQDAVQEFKVGTNSVSAEFGRFSGGVVEMSTKSGSNSFHGSAYEYHRNTVLNASVAKISNNALVTPTTKQKWLQNQYGVAVGGPVLKNKAFFFFSWEKFSSRTGNLDTGNVPDAGMLSATDPSVPGDATHWSEVVNGVTVVHDVVLPSPLPSAATCLTYVATDTSDYATNGRTHINPSCLDSTAQVVKNYFAPANQKVVVGKTNYQYFVPLGDDNQQFNVRGDLNLGNHRIFMRYSHLNNTDMSSRDMQDNAGFLTGGAVSYYPTHQAVVGDTITVNPTTILDIRLSYTRAYSDDMPPSAGIDLTKAGTAGLNFGGDWPAINAQQAVKLLPSFSWNGGYSLWGFRGFVIDNRYADISALSYSATKIKGAHSIKVGGEIANYGVDALPQFQMGTVNITAGNYAHNEWANFLLGAMDKFTFSKPIRTSSYYWYQGYYVTDTWNATRKLTLTGGLRWELPGAFGEKHDRGNVLLPDQTATINGAPAYGTLALLNTTAYPHRGNELPRKTLLSPRLGVAYRLSNNTVLRAGYALAYVPIDIQQAALPSASPVNLAPTTTTNTASTLIGSIKNPLGGQTINQPTGASDPNFMTKYANTAALQDITAPAPTSNKVYTQQWNLTVGQQFKGQQSVEVGYAGMIGIHLLNQGQSGWQLNQIASSLFDSNGVVTSGPYVGQSLTANAPAGACGPAGITRTVGQCLRPHPAYNSLFDGVPAHSTMTYHAMQVRYQKRLGTGMISSGWTWSKSIGDTDTVAAYLNNGAIGGNQDYNNPKGDRSILSYNISHRWVTSYIVPLPIGKGQKFLNSLNPVVDRIIGGWTINGITTLQSGQPLTITQGNGNTLNKNFGAGTIRPNVVAGCSKAASGGAQSRLGKWFNTSCFTPVGNYAFGNQPRADSQLKGSGQANWDFTLQKATEITESTNLSFRVEFFNIFNRRQFAQPSMNVNAGNFGAVTSQQNNPRQIQAALRFNF